MADPKLAAWRNKTVIDAEKAAEDKRTADIAAARERIRTGAPANNFNMQQLAQRVADIEIALGLREP